MARRSSWFAVALVLALLFVTSHCLRGPATRDEIRDTTLRSRGVSRFSTKAAEGLETTPEPFTSTTRSPRRGTKITNRANASINQRSKLETTEKSNTITERVTQNLGRRKPFRSDLSRAASEDRRYLPEPSANRDNRNEELLLEAPDVTQVSSRSQRNFPARNSRAEFQRRSDSVDPIDDSTENPRSRSGRKIRPTAQTDFKESSRFSSQSGRVVKSDVRRSTERNFRRHDSDLSNSNQVNVGIPFSTEVPTPSTTASRSRKAHERTRSLANDKSETLPNLGRGSKRITSKKVDGIDGNSLDEFKDSKRKPEEIKPRKSSKSLESTSGSGRRSRGRSPEPRSETSDKFQVEARSRDVASDKNKLDRRGRVSDKVKLVKSNYLGTGSSRSRSRSQTKQSVLSSTESSKEFATSTTYSSTTLLEEATTLFPSTLQPPTESPSIRRASKLAPKIPPKEDYFNRGLGFRGRKFATSTPNPATTTTPSPIPSSAPSARSPSGWTLNRRPYAKNSTVDLLTTTTNPTTTTPAATTISNEIPSNDPVSTTSRPRGKKVFNKASIILKVDREIDDNDNYPPEFKAKLAQLKNNSVKESGSESSPRVTKDVTISRQTRSIEPTDLLGKHSEVNDSPEGTNSSATPFAKLESYKANEGPKNLEGNTSFAARSRQNLANAQRQAKPESEPLKSSSPPGASKRYGSGKLTSTTPRIITVTVPKDDGFTRTSKSIERGSTRVGETTRVRQYRKQGTTNEPVSAGKVDPTTERIKAMRRTTTERINDQMITTEKTIHTTRKSRAWNSAYIDKNWQESTSKSTNAEKVTTQSSVDSLPKLNKRPRPWNAAYIDKNWQEPASKPANAEKITADDSHPINSSFKLNKRPRNWNPGHVDKTWQEPTKADRTTEATTPNSSNKFEKKAPKYVVSSTTEKLQTEKSFKIKDKARRRDFRSRTATYRRHLESPVSRNSQEVTANSKDRKTSAEWLAEVNKLTESVQVVTPEVEKKELPSVAITPRYHALIKTENSTQQSVKHEPAVSLLSNATDSKVESEAQGLSNSTGISSSSRGTSGNSDSNIFNPTKTTYLISSNASLLEQLRSTVAPLLSVLGAKTPEFATAYSKVNNVSLSVPRVTPSGSPPRFSAKYRGVEFFVRKPSDTNSTRVDSTTPLSIDQAKKPSIPVSISSPGEPKVLTYYQALETVNINNEIEQQLGGIGKDEMTSTAQTTPSFQQTTTSTTTTTTTELPLSTTSPSSESTTSIPDTTIPSSTSQADNSLPTTTELPSSATESTTIPVTVQSLPLSSSSPSSSSSMLIATTASPEMMSSTEMPTKPSPTTTSTTMSSTTAYFGRFGGSRMTPAPRLSSSSSTKTPLRDYHVYGIYPNKTIVRKRPEDNLIDARNIDSPYVIFGIFPDGKLVRKFPNGTVIPDPPSNPVEVVFSLSTSTTTNRPTPQTQVLLQNKNNNNNQANNVNQPMNNNNGSATASSNNRPGNMTLLTNVSGDQINDGYRSRINLGLADNSINYNGADEDPNQFADPTLLPGIGNVNTQPTTTTMVTDASSRTAGPPLGATPSSVNSQGGRIIQDIERDKASRTKEAGGQRSTVYIGQEKFINYWTNDTQPSNNSRIVSVEINSISSASHQGPDAGSLPSLDILTNNNIQGQGTTAQANNRWKDPLDQIFGITTRPSVASNILQDESRSAITARPINPLSEVLTPVLDANQLARDTSITITDATTNTTTSSSTTSTTSTTTTPATTTTTTPAITTTTTPATTTTTTTTTAAPTTTTSSSTSTTTTSTTAATTTSSTTPPTTTTTTTTIAPTSRPTTTVAPTTLPPSSSAPPTTNTISESTLSPFTTIDVPHQTAFGSTFDDLAFLNSLLQSSDNSNSIGSTPKTLTEVERQLANKILSLALSKVAGPTRSPKAIQPSNVSPNSLDAFPRPSFGHSSSSPIIIDLLEPTTKKPVARITTREPFTWKPVTDVTSTTPTTTTTSSKPTVSTTTTTTTTTTPATTSTSTSTSTTSTSSTTVTPSTQVTWKPFPKQPPTLKPIESIPVTKQTSVKAFTGKPINRPKPTTPPPLGFGAGLLQAIFGRNIFAPPTTQRPVIRKPVQTTTTTSKPIQITELVIPTAAVRNQVQAASQHVNDVRLLNSLLGDTKVSTSTFSPEDDAKFLLELLKDSEKNAGKGVKGSSVLSQDDETFLRSILSGQAKVRTPSSVSGNSDSNNAALLAQLLKVQGIEPSTPANRLQEQLQGIKVTSMPPVQTTARVIATTKKSVTRPRPSDWQPSSTYPPPLFSNFNFGFPRGESYDDDDNSSRGGVRNQVLNAAIGATRVFSQFLGAAITGAAQQLQSFVRNSTKYVTGAVGG
ncbi:mucin-5AC-like isoform X3 [Cotesia glomerata]|uniref:mucin-5AC-like isoform X3 n=1 Tax=Cotesia glomerata TaxID=32391 RepID=UPI001D032824|nr:mucin-5AC-like isoform X3 [Cotesia glomerata]